MPYEAPYLQFSEMQKARGNRAMKDQQGYAGQVTKGILSLDEMLQEMQAKEAKATQQKFENERATGNDTFNQGIAGRSANVNEANLKLNQDKQASLLAEQDRKLQEGKVMEGVAGGALAQFADRAKYNDTTPSKLVHEANIDRLYRESPVAGLTRDQIAKAYYEQYQGLDNEDRKLSAKEKTPEDKRRPVPVATGSEIDELEARTGALTDILSNLRSNSAASVGMKNNIKAIMKERLKVGEDKTRFKLMSEVANYMFRISGKTITDKERATLEQFMPSWSQNPEMLVAQIAKMYNDYARKHNIMIKNHPPSIYKSDHYTTLPEIGEGGNFEGEKPIVSGGLNPEDRAKADIVDTTVDSVSNFGNKVIKGVSGLITGKKETNDDEKKRKEQEQALKDLEGL